jgi:gluconolactonase
MGSSLIPLFLFEFRDGTHSISRIMNIKRIFGILTALTLLSAVQAADSQETNKTEQTQKPAKKDKKEPHVYPTMGTIERIDPGLGLLLRPDARIEKLAGGFKWAEGPVWIRNGGYLLFSDVPNNVVFKWQEEMKTREFLMPSGYTGSVERGGEPGSNGLTVDSKGRLVLCQHGDRQIGRLEKNGKVATVARYYNFRRFNSPNDLCYKSNGDLYFTDPPYGLLKGNDDPAKELNFNGVFRVKANGDVTLLTSELTFPNGIAFSPDEKTLYVAVSDPKRAIWMAYDVKGDGTLGAGRVFNDVTNMTSQKQGLPDGLKVDKQGNLWASGPGGILIFAKDGKHLGTLATGVATANCAWGDDGSTLYITADTFLCRVKTSTKGVGF